jgi:manganese/iron transport system ATP-binding protein
VTIGRCVTGPTATTFTQANLEQAFGGVLRHFRLEGNELHQDDDRRTVTVLTDDERPVVFYGEGSPSDRPRSRSGGEEPS